MMGLFVFLAAQLTPGVKVTAEARRVNGAQMSATVAWIDMKKVKPKVVLGNNRVGGTESLESMAKRVRGLAAINGSFFDAYVDGPTKSPHHTVISEGVVVHKGNVGSLIGFKDDGSAVIGRFEISIKGRRGSDKSWLGNWYAYWINRQPTAATVTIFTRKWGLRTRLTGGTQIVVSQGVVVKIAQSEQDIPVNGYVIYVDGVADSAFGRFRIGDKVDYRIEAKSGTFGPFEEAIGAGPTLIKDGKVCLDAESEGFRDPKILTSSGLRSAIGIMPDGTILLVATSGKVADVAQLMKLLGVRDAMNLDGGASSGLFANGKMLRKPGREISNALVFLPRS